MNRSQKTEEETQLLACYSRILAKREQLKKLKIQKEEEKKNEIPMIKKTLADKKMTKQEIASQVKNASSATERAKMLLKQGKLQINATKSTGFKRRPGAGRRQRPLEMENENESPKKPRVNLPTYADDDDDVTASDPYAAIPTGDIDLKPTQKPFVKKPSQNPNQRKPPGNRINQMDQKRKLIAYDDDPF